MKEHLYGLYKYRQIESICKRLTKATRACDHDSIPMSFVLKRCTSDTVSNEQNLDQLPPTYMYSVIFKDIILEIDDDDAKLMNTLVKFCRQQENIPETEINALKSEYDRKIRVWWYTKPMFLYGMLNRALQMLDMEGEKAHSGIPSHSKPIAANRSQSQPFPAIPSHSEPIAANRSQSQPSPAILSHSRTIAAIPSHSQTFEWLRMSFCPLDFDTIFQYQNTNRWDSLKLSDAEHTPGQMAYFFENHALTGEFSQLRSFSIVNIIHNHPHPLFAQLSSLSNLVSLEIESLCGENIPEFELPHLKKLTFTSCPNTS
ncbi:unnamed protein product [Rotaria magnacalcarata]|uniref:Uncharacterized protein n=1 Tax=Rotaria magnacalcarata TaxID=392030 RepID=A0A817A1H9_9BILA|nr:unnamed protein product [Rotaria magnacalcarata]